MTKWFMAGQGKSSVCVSVRTCCDRDKEEMVREYRESAVRRGIESSFYLRDFSQGIDDFMVVCSTTRTTVEDADTAARDFVRYHELFEMHVGEGQISEAMHAMFHDDEAGMGVSRVRIYEA